ncbi:MAG: sigma-70 family RNA polymerase sigma factor [Verrucomicrobiales bacterium]|nr:sigma-70 family RNA polymerase sigma factor [Verrucomicrobiales bacterium]
MPTAKKAPPTRASLLERLRDSDDAASWEEFHRLYAPMVMEVGRRTGLSEEEAEDVVQETFLAVLKALPGFRYEPARSSFKHWLQTLTSHRISEHFRRQNGRTGARARFGVHGRPATEVLERVADPHGPEIDAVWQEEWERVREQLAFERLKDHVRPQHYQLFHLLREGKSLPEAAQTLGLSRAQAYLIKHRVAKVLKKLANELEV